MFTLIRYRLLILWIIFLIISGCGIGGWWMNGDPSVGREPFKPEYLNFSKSESDANDLQRAWVGCGGTSTGVVDVPSAKNLSIAESSDMYDKKYDEVYQCMLDKNYKYIGSCKGPLWTLLPCRRHRP